MFGNDIKVLLGFSEHDEIPSANVFPMYSTSLSQPGAFIVHDATHRLMVDLAQIYV